MSRSLVARCLAAAALLLAALATATVGATSTSRAGVPLPPGWPAHLLVGMSDAENGAADLRAETPLEARYHYLSGGVNTGKGWLTWAEGDGSFVTNYIADSAASSFLPVFSLYEIRPSHPGIDNPDEAAGDLLNLRTKATMRAFFAELRVFYDRAAAAGGPVVLHVEPDLWGYVERAAHGGADSIPAQVASTGFADLKGLPNNAAGLAQAIVRMRDLYAPNVILGYHVSIWGTGEDISRSDPSDAHVDELAGQSEAFYRSLGANFDVLFAEFADRDSGYAVAVDHDVGSAWWDAGDFDRHARYLADISRALSKRIVLWQIPLGNRIMRADDNTRFHYQDNRVEWLLGPQSRAHLTTYLNAGVIGLLFGKAQPGDTCACDDAHDGVTNPPAVDGNTAASLSADDDGGYFKRQVTAFYHDGPLPLPAAVTRPARATKRRHAPVLRLTASASQPAIRRGHRLFIDVDVTSKGPARALVAVQLFPPGSRRPAYQLPFRNQRFHDGRRKTLRLRFNVPRDAPIGTWVVKVGVFDPDWTRLYLWTEHAAQFNVR
jgi:hypothetical protein